MATNNSVNSPLSGTTGTGNFVGSTSPTLVTPSIGVATGTSFNTITGVASKANQQAASSATVVVTPSVQQYHPSATQVWGAFDGTAGSPTTSAAYNVSSITKNSAGNYTVNYTTSFAGASYGVIVTVKFNGSHSMIGVIGAAGKSTGGVNIVSYATNAIDTPADTPDFNFACFGAQ